MPDHTTVSRTDTITHHCPPRAVPPPPPASPPSPSPRPPSPVPPPPPRVPVPASTAAPAPATPGGGPGSTRGTGGEQTQDDPPQVILPIRAWLDPIVDNDGHDPRSLYVETFWLGVLGPTTTWLLRRLVAGLDRSPDGYDLDLRCTAASMGLSFTAGRTSPFSKALQRCMMFGLAHPVPSGGLAVRRRIPRVAHRHLRRLPASLQLEHARWEHSAVASDELARAHRLALAMLDVGDEPRLVEHRLHALGVGPSTAAAVTDNMVELSS